MSRLFSWTLNIVYLTALLVACPWILWVAYRHGKYREGFAEKFWGQVPERVGQCHCVWLHAVSVGEVNVLATLLRELKARRPTWELMISTTTKAGYDLARKKYADHTVFYCPLDFSWAVSRAMRRVRPDLLVLAELELWPNLISAAEEQGARVVIINGRLSDKSFRGYSRFRPLVSRVLAMLDLIAAQNRETADRFRQLGADPTAVQSTGSLKFDGALLDRENRQTCQLRELAGFEIGDIVFLAGSTQAPEEEMALNVYRELVAEFPRLRLVLVPRHPERFKEVADLLTSSGLCWTLRSQLESANRNQASSILLVDTIGELGAWWGTASIGFVGGSFGSRGGQNMLEPAAFGVATCFGPNTCNFRDVVSQLLTANAAAVVQNEAQLGQFVRHSLSQPNSAREIGQRARKLVISQQGATARTVDLLLRLVSDDTRGICAA